MHILFRAVASVAAVAVLVVLSIAAWFAYAAYGDRALPAATTQVIIVRGSSLADIAQQLASNGVISNVMAFRLLAKLQNRQDDARAGAYRFAPHQTQNEVLHALVTGGAQVARWVTFPEGFTDRQIASRLQSEGIANARVLERVFAATSLNVDGTRTPSLEGYLFPSTYLVDVDATPAQIVSTLTGQFFKELPSDAAARAAALHVTVPQAVTVASLVEREAKIDADRPMIAGVIYNRLRAHMPLQVDATIEYALPHHKAELSYADLRIDSPYNTYLHDGLPPTPIANPGLPSLEAALHPAKTDALYYVYCGGGHHVFAKTLQQHQANVARCLK
ncbi:MAG: endolytic transglycosylase MltG [Vulcanimicrobiaceae bacterium]